MTTILIHVAGYMLICACALAAPHASQRTGINGSLAFSAMAAVSISVFAYLELIA